MFPTAGPVDAKRYFVLILLDEPHGTARSAGYAVLNLGADLQVSPAVSLGLQVNNLLDRRYSTAAQLGAAGFDANGNFQARAFGGSAAAGFAVQQSTFYAPGAPRSTRQVQASSSLFFDVFRKFDPGNLLLAQAEAETLAQELDVERLQRCLHRFAREPAPVEAAGAEPHHFLLAVDDLEREVGAHPDHDHVDRVGADVDGGKSHGQGAL